MTRERRIIDALLLKTEANGCTPSEAQAARAKAEEMAKKYGLTLETPKTVHRTVTVDPEAFARNWAARHAAQQAEAMHAKAKAMAEEAARRKAAAAEAERKRYEDMMARNREKRTQAEKKVKEQPKTRAHTGMHFSSIGEAARWYLRFNSHLSHGEIAAKVREHFPNAKTSAESVAWYASKMRKGK